jgi:hypothetical protein
MEKGKCEICETEIEIHICCSGYMCGCMGMPTEPPVCSSECYDKLMDKYRIAKLKQIALNNPSQQNNLKLK